MPMITHHQSVLDLPARIQLIDEQTYQDALDHIFAELPEGWELGLMCWIKDQAEGKTPEEMKPIYARALGIARRVLEEERARTAL